MPAKVHIIEIPDNIDVDVETNSNGVFINGARVNVGKDIRAISVKVEGATLRDVKAGGSVTCDDVTGNVKADGSVRCGNVGGSAKAGGSVTCDDVGGSASAGGSVKCGKVDGSVSAGGSVKMIK